MRAPALNRTVYRSWTTLWRLAFYGVGVLVLVLSLLPVEVSVPSTGWDKTNHMLAFGSLAVLGCLAYPAHIRRVIIGLILYGVLIEVVQGLSGYRYAELGDLIADIAGLALGWLVVVLYLRIRQP